MKQYRVDITGEALADMEQLYHHIAHVLLAPETAMCLYDRIADEILKLAYFPERFRIIDAEPEHSRGIRRMLVDNYSVFYVVKDDRVIVTDVLYSACDIESRLRGFL
ncbi:MAG: type II toxin-antitoxin system RelE/ParE family toxin [Bacillota bacterium]|nr:type II toxin-antitoxin system RelE/ParE family toxin [Bacillota bacterium]